jgi:hypothetical protein
MEGRPVCETRPQWQADSTGERAIGRIYDKLPVIDVVAIWWVLSCGAAGQSAGFGLEPSVLIIGLGQGRVLHSQMRKKSQMRKPLKKGLG